MYWFWIIPAVPLVFLLFVSLLRYIAWSVRHRDFVAMEYRRDSLMAVNRKDEPDRVDEWYRRKKFERSYNRATKRVRRNCKWH
ncbi:MAG: hypothetical protein HDQ88_02865 [Clostridia bacterium]|nr:hypothetical protein [Clostridia bacterium]